MTKWVIKNNNKDYKKLASETGISDHLASMLTYRGVESSIDAFKFLDASVNDFHDEMLFKDMSKGVKLIYEAVKNNRKLVVYGDYDADGILSTYILYSAISYMGADVKYYIPDREEEGYGMNFESIKSLRGAGCDVILTCDNGISSIEEIRFAKKMGFTVVVTDHHEVTINDEGIEVIPEADAIINSKQKDCEYPFKDLCGAGIALKFVYALYKYADIPVKKAYRYLEFAAIATICDIVDLVGENRIIVKNGLKMLEKTENEGLKALLEVLCLTGENLKTYHVGYVIGPCINASGRIDSAGVAMELLLCKDYKKALKIALNLRELNKKRQDMTEKGYNRILESIINYGRDKDKVILVYDRDVHESIAGIIAGRIKEEFNKPAIVLTCSRDNDFAKGSGRSIEMYNMFEELNKCKDLLHKFGGHKMAAGLTVHNDNIDMLRSRLNLNSSLEETDFVRKITIEKHIPIKEVTMDMVDDIELLEPFGKGNPSPVFGDRKLCVTKYDVLGVNRNTIKLEINNGSNKIYALGFNMVDHFSYILGKDAVSCENLRNVKCDLNIDMVFVPTINDFRGNRSLQLKIIDIRKSNV